MLYLALIYHMHQPYYKNLLTQEIEAPWVRLHGIKDYLDMVEILSKYPELKLTFNLVPSLLEQIKDYTENNLEDKYLKLSYKPTEALTYDEKNFILENFFQINKDRVISLFPRYYELYLKKQAHQEFNLPDYLDLVVWFNLAWFDPDFRCEIPPLRRLVQKARFFSEEEKLMVLEKQKQILKEIIPSYKKFSQSGQIELTTSPFYHPILPLLYNTKIAKEANPKVVLPSINFSYPQDLKAQLDLAVQFHKSHFGNKPEGLWPSEEAVSEHILPFIIQAGINWIVTDEAILFKSLKKKKRDTQLLYQPHLLRRKEGTLNIVFRDRNLSDLISFVYYNWPAEVAVGDFLKHLENIYQAFREKDVLVVVALDGENAWEYYPNDGHDFLQLLYQRLLEAKFLKTTTISEYLKINPAQNEIERLSSGSWIYANFNKWIGSNQKNKAWEKLAKVRKELENPQSEILNPDLVYKQMYILEGSDWFWWYDEGNLEFDRLFQMHLANLSELSGCRNKLTY